MRPIVRSNTGAVQTPVQVSVQPPTHADATSESRSSLTLTRRPRVPFASSSTRTACFARTARSFALSSPAHWRRVHSASRRTSALGSNCAMCPSSGTASTSPILRSARIRFFFPVGDAVCIAASIVGIARRP